MIETLEPRRLLSATVTEGYPGFYEVHGTDGADAINVSVSMNDETMTIDGATYSGVQYILVHGYGGDDAITLTSTDGMGYVSASVSAGDGADSVSLNFDGGIWGGGGNDTLRLSDSYRGEVHGGGGDDRIYVLGACYDSQIDGGGGDDVIDCSGSAYRVYARGGTGQDTITGSPGNDHLRGDEGDDVIDGGGGDYDVVLAD